MSAARPPADPAAPPADPAAPPADEAQIAAAAAAVEERVRALAEARAGARAAREEEALLGAALRAAERNVPEAKARGAEDAAAAAARGAANLADEAERREANRLRRRLERLGEDLELPGGDRRRSSRIEAPEGDEEDEAKAEAEAAGDPPVPSVPLAEPPAAAAAEDAVAATSLLAAVQGRHAAVYDEDVDPPVAPFLLVPLPLNILKRPPAMLRGHVLRAVRLLETDPDLYLNLPVAVAAWWNRGGVSADDLADARNVIREVVRRLGLLG